jgi:hypothetical protein
VDTSLKYDTVVIYGRIIGYLNPDGIMSCSTEKYNFDIKGYSDVNTMADAFARTKRNVFTGMALLVNGMGEEFTIYFKGSVPAPTNLPK